MLSDRLPVEETRSFKNGDQLRQHFVHDHLGNSFQLLGAARGEIEHARLIAPDNAGGLGAGAGQRDGKARRPRETAAAGDGDDD